MSEQNQHAEALFEALSKNKKLQRRRVLRTVLITIAVIAAILIGTVIVLTKKVENRFAAAAAEVQAYQVTSGTIHTIVSGTGVLTEEDLETISVPSGVEITEVIAEAGHTVREGDLLATVDLATVMTSLTDLQDQMNDLDKKINSAKGDKASSQISAGVSGRVKIIHAEAGMDVSLCMAEQGCLAVLSLDGYMAADLKTEKLSKGDTVTVTLEDGTQLEGSVSAAAGGNATVLVSDNGPGYDEEVSVTAEDGTLIGTARLYINNPLGVTGYAGTISTVTAKENMAVTSGSSLFTLKNTSFSANYDTLLRNREDLEEILMELLTLYRDGALLAPMDGVVSSVEYDDSTGTSTYTTDSGGTGVLTLYPDTAMTITIGVDETDILALEEDQEAEITVSSVGDEVYPGVVTDISKVADTSTGVTQYSAQILMDKAPGMLPGMTADVDVKIQGTENALIIPVDAMHQTSTGAFVYTSYDEETKRYGGRVDVVAGMQNDNYVEILSGLQEGDTVYYVEPEQSFFGFGMMPSGMGGMGSGGNRPSGGGMGSGSNRPSGGGMPSGMGSGSGRPSGGMPSGMGGQMNRGG